LVEALGRRLDDLYAEVGAVVESQRDLARSHEALVSRADPAGPLVEALGRRLDDAGEAAAERDRLVQQGMSRLSAMVAALRSDLETSIDTAMGFEMETARKAQEDLSDAQGDMERRLHGLERRLQDALDRMAIPADQPVRAPAGAPQGGTLLDGLEEQLLAAQRRLTVRAAMDRMDTLVGPRQEPERRS
jgi:signal transduction histidine kinase